MSAGPFIGAAFPVATNPTENVSVAPLAVSSSPAATSPAPASTAPLSMAAWDNMYWLAQPDAVRVLRGMKFPDSQGVAIQLAVKGYIIDAETMVNGWGPYIVMSIRKAAGYTWVPNAMQAQVQVVPGLGEPGLTTYDPNNPPPGSIKVSLDPADYPPYDPPPPPPPPAVATEPAGRHVGPRNSVGLFTVLIPLTADGLRIEEDGQWYVYHLYREPFATNKIIQFYEATTAPTT